MQTLIGGLGDPVGSLLLLINSSSAARASIVTIFNDFGPGNTYGTFQASPITGPDIPVFGYRAFAMPFTSLIEANITQIDLGFGAVPSGTSDAVTVNLNINDGGTLGRTLRSWSLSHLNLPSSITNNNVETIDNIRGVHLKEGSSYYLYITPADPTTFVNWNINDIGTMGTRLFFSPGGVLSQFTALSTFRIFGTPTPPTAVPLPATLPLFASGLAGLGWLSRRRRKQTAPNGLVG